MRILHYCYFFNDFFALQCYRNPLMLSTYSLGGLVGLSILFMPSEWVWVRVCTYLLAQGVITASFVLADEIAAEIVSTDTRSTTFVIVDGVSKVRNEWFKTIRIFFYRKVIAYMYIDTSTILVTVWYGTFKVLQYSYI